MLLRKRVLTGILCVLCAPAIMWPQSQNSGISGTVTDPSGAGISGAEVSATNLQRQITAKTTSGSDGLYSFPNLEPGNYEPKVSASGFTPLTQTGISLLVNQSARID